VQQRERLHRWIYEGERTMVVLTFNERHNARHQVALTNSAEKRDLNTERQTDLSRGWTDFSIDTTTWTEKRCQRARVAVPRIKGIGGEADVKH
jgi:hypothetical protein